eukprot:1165168-Rhodomonas_salina.2
MRYKTGIHFGDCSSTECQYSGIPTFGLVQIAAQPAKRQGAPVARSSPEVHCSGKNRRCGDSPSISNSAMRIAVAIGVLLALTAVSAFHTPYRPEQSRHFDVTKSSTFHPITEKVRAALAGYGCRLDTQLGCRLGTGLDCGVFRLGFDI